VPIAVAVAAAVPIAVAAAVPIAVAVVAAVPIAVVAAAPISVAAAVPIAVAVEAAVPTLLVNINFMLVAATIVERIFTITGSQTRPNNQLETTEKNLIHNINVKKSFIRRIEAENRERVRGSNNSNTASDTSGNSSRSSIPPSQRLL
jgi:hypothetical protein